MSEIEKITEFLETHNFGVSSNNKQDDDYVIEFGQFTPLGEDWYVSLFYDGTLSNFKEKLSEYADNFDIDEEVEPYIENRGNNGVPTSIRALLEDAEWKQQQLKALSK